MAESRRSQASTERMYRDHTRIMLRPIASGVPLGFFSFALGMFMLGCLGVGLIPVDETKTVGLIIAMFVFPLELIATLFAFLARDSTSAATLGIFTTSWLTLGVLSAINGAGQSKAIGIFLLGFCGIVLLLAVMAISAKPFFTLMLSVALGRALFAGIYDVGGSHAFLTTSGYIALVTSVLALYGGVAFTLEDSKQRQVLPLFRRGPASEAFGGYEQQLSRLEAEPGIRQQL